MQRDRAVDDATILARLDEARARTWRLVQPLDEVDWRTPQNPVLGPIAWDLGHMTTQWDLWLVQTLAGRPEARPGINDTYDAYRNPRPTRVGLPLLSKKEALRFSDEVRARVAEVLVDTPQGARAGPLWSGRFVHWMMVLHEYQHDETILQGLQCVPPERYTFTDRRPRRTAVDGARDGPEWVTVPGGPFRMGVPRQAGTYDNEWPPQTVTLPTFQIARHPVTNGDWLRFMAAGGYDDERLWQPVGWRQRHDEGLVCPLHWRQGDDGWERKRMDRWVPVDPDEPVVHVSWYEADAYARWTGHRLPTEAEWEKAATWDPHTGTKRTWPWGDARPEPARANLDQGACGPEPVGSHPEGRSPLGVEDLIGDVWEWTSSDFLPYTGFIAFPYDDYSAKFFGDNYKVLRGGSWASRPGLALGTFRNWDLPVRRQIFAGLRLVRDAVGKDHDAPHHR